METIIDLLFREYNALHVAVAMVFGCVVFFHLSAKAEKKGFTKDAEHYAHWLLYGVIATILLMPYFFDKIPEILEL